MPLLPSAWEIAAGLSSVMMGAGSVYPLQVSVGLTQAEAISSPSLPALLARHAGDILNQIPKLLQTDDDVLYIVY